MDFYEVLDQIIGLLKQRGRVTYRTLRRQFTLDDETLEDLKEELLFSHPVVDEDGRGLVWTGETEENPVTPGQLNQLEPRPMAKQAEIAQTISPPIEPHTPDAERRQLTVMFCDLVGSTELSGQFDPEEYREMVRAYQDACGDVIERFGCHVAQTLGDGLLVYSGFPVAHENDAERAVRVGLGILDAMKALNERLEDEQGIRLAVRVGIHTGPVVVGEIGAGSRQEQLALGETPNVAARIQGIAQPDTIVISEATYRLTQGYFDCQELGEQHLRGVSQPINIYQVFRESGAQSRLDIVSRHGLTPLIGREKEVGLLLERWQQAKEGQGQVVLLRGEAGIGKSHLVQVLKEHIADAAHTLLECRSSPYYHNTALYPITDLWQRMLRWQPDETADEQLNKLEQALSQYRLPGDEAVPLMAGLLSLSWPEDRYPPLNLTPQRQRQKTLETIITMLVELAERQPMLFVVEDLHWTDPSTLELLDLLIDQTPTASIYALLTCRPEFQAQWANRSYFTQVTLNRLSRDEIEQMATKVSGGKTLPDAVLQQLVDKTDGVPLYVEEMTKSVLESGQLKGIDGHYELTSPMSSLSIPTTLQDSLMARLDRLVTAKGIAQYASVIGRQFSYELLQAVSELDEATLKRELERLVDAELVYQRGSPPHATYAFKHALIQDTAYESLLRSTRQGYHQRIAQMLEAQFPETIDAQPELLAHHYTEAGLGEQAVVYWQRAGQLAIEHSANVEAVAHLSKGLDTLKTLPEDVELKQYELRMQLTLGPALMAIRGYGAPEVGETFSRAIELCKAKGSPQQYFQALWGFWRFNVVGQEVTQASALADDLLALAQQTGDSAHLIEAHNARGITLFYLGEFSQALSHFELAVALYDPQSHPSLAFLYGQDPGVICHSFASLTLWILGYPTKALQRSQEALSLAQDPFSLAYALFWTSLPLQCCWQSQLVQERAETAIALSKEQGFVLWLTGGMILQGWAHVQHGEFDEGLAQIKLWTDHWATTESKRPLPYLLSLLGEAHTTNREVQEGLSVLDRSLAEVEKYGECWWEAELYRLKGNLFLAHPPRQEAEAETCFLRAIDIASRQQAKSLELRAATSLARLWESQGKHQEAYDLLAPVYNWFTDGFDTADLKDAKMLLDELS